MQAFSSEEKIAYNNSEAVLDADTIVFDPEDGSGNLRDWVGFTPSKCHVKDGILSVVVILS